LSVTDEADKRLEMAYEAANQRLSLQDTTLTSTRTRANNLLATTALFVSFSTGVGLINTDPSRGPIFPTYAAIVLLVLVVALGACVLYVAWPTKNWSYTPSAKKILVRVDADDDEASIRRYVTDEMISGAERNQAQLAPRQNAYRGAVILLVLEVALLLAILAA
jgi:hypothetical protein